MPIKFKSHFLGIEGTLRDNTKFDRSVTDYLMTQGVSAHKLQAQERHLKRLMDEIMLEIKEDLCRAVIDVCKNISIGEMALVVQFFVLGDEGMEGGGSVLTQAAVLKNNEAIVVARSEKVKVYTYQERLMMIPLMWIAFLLFADRDNITRRVCALSADDGRTLLYMLHNRYR